MKVLHISTFTGGGAGTAAVRLHIGLLEEGIDSKFLALSTDSEQVPKNIVFSPNNLAVAKKIIGKLAPLTTTSRNVKKLMGKKGVYELFTFPNSDFDVSRHPLVEEADIINLHWVTKFIDFPSFFKKVKKPIVWTLHDMNPFQGGFHYKEDEVRNKSILNKLDLKLKKQKERIYQESFIKKVVAPSNWLKTESTNSTCLGRFNHVQIPYGLDTEIFRPLNSSFARQVFQLAEDRKILLFVAGSIDIHRKGFDLLLNAAKEFNYLGGSLQLVAVGKFPHSKAEGVTYLGPIKDERLMALAYSAADAFILPSREDNLPNVMLESLACGTPVLTTPVGGMLDVIRNGFNGYLAKELSVAGLQEVIRLFMKNSSIFDRQEIRKDAVYRFNLSVQAKRYIELYKELIQNT
jgi:glycosyltransferase involved in cell wall biosynthesis